jgi:histone chaperone ASF1
MKGVTVLLLQCSYRQKEFIRVGYYVNNEMPGDTIVQPLTLDNPAAAAASSNQQQHQPTATEAMMLALQQQDPQQTLEDRELNQGLPADPNLLIRSVLADKPRVTRFNIPWTAAQEAEIDMNNDNIMGSSTGAASGADGTSAGGGTGRADDMMDYDDIGMQLDEIGITDDESSAEDSANDGNHSSNENDNVEIDLDEGDSDGSNQYDDDDQDDDDDMANA